MRTWRSNRFTFLTVSLLAAAVLIVTSQSGLLRPFEDLAAIPLNLVAGALNRLTLQVVGGVESLVELQTLRQRNADLEEALARYQAELVELREIASDYQRLAELLDYTTRASKQQFLTADVISIDQMALRRTLTINRGTRDGVAVGMPVVTGKGLVGRVIAVGATSARVLLITDRDSAVSARLQSTRAVGSVRGQTSGSLRMEMIPLGQQVQVGDLVITSGLGGNFPPDIVIGVVTSTRQFEFELAQEAEVASFNDFDSLEFVLVITNFEPVDISALDG